MSRRIAAKIHPDPPKSMARIEVNPGKDWVAMKLIDCPIEEIQVEEHGSSQSESVLVPVVRLSWDSAKKLCAVLSEAIQRSQQIHGD